MNDARYKELMEQVGMRDSRSILQALKQVANEVAQEIHAEYGRKNWADPTQKQWKIPESHAIICPGCGWIGTKIELNDHECPQCNYMYEQNIDLLTLEALLTNEESWDEVALGPFALSVCRVLRINNLFDLAMKLHESKDNCNLTFHDVSVFQNQATHILKKIKGGK